MVVAVTDPREEEEGRGSAGDVRGLGGGVAVVVVRVEWEWGVTS
jgi:hypothetical protein